MTPDDHPIGSTPVAGVALLYQAVREMGWVGEIRGPLEPMKVTPVEHRDAVYAAKASRWCAKALDGKTSDLAAMVPDSGRNIALNNAGLALYRYVLAGYLDSEDVTERLREAALECGLSNGEIEATLHSAQRGAEKYGPQEPPLDPPETPERVEGVDMTTGEVPLTPEELAERAHQRRVREELHILRARDEAKTIFVAERAARQFREPPSVLTLRDELLIPDEPVQYAIAELLPIGANALLAAQFKAGKTSVVNNYARSFADGTLFLGRYAIDTGGGRVALSNYELPRDMNRRWLREMNIQHPERISVLNLRGFRLPITSPVVEDWIVRWLVEREVTAWVVDPFARAALGIEENSNTEVGVWLDTLDVIKERAGVRDLILPTHTGRAEQEQGAERARGATRLDDWADVRWLLTRNEEGDRFFRATGRDVDVPEELLSFEESTRSLTIGGGDRAWQKMRNAEKRLFEWIKVNPGQGAAEVQNSGGNKVENESALKRLTMGHQPAVRVDQVGRRHAHYVTRDAL